MIHFIYNEIFLYKTFLLQLNCTVNEKALDPDFPFVFLEEVEHLGTLPFSFTETGVFRAIISIWGRHSAFALGKLFKSHAACKALYLHFKNLNASNHPLGYYVLWIRANLCKWQCCLQNEIIKFTWQPGQMSLVTPLAGMEELDCLYHRANPIWNKVIYSTVTLIY